MGIKRSVFTELKFNLLVLVFLVSITIILMDYYIIKNNMLKQYNFQKQTLVEQVKRAYVFPLWHVNIKEVELITNCFLQSNIVGGIRVGILPDNKIIYKKYKKRFPKRYETVRVDIVYMGKRLGYVEIESSRYLYNSILRHMLITNLFNLFFVLLIIYWGTTIILKKIINEPMDVLLFGMEKIGDGDYDYKFPSVEYEEFSRAIKGMEQLASTIRERELDIKKSEEKFRSLAENAPLGILIYQGEKWVYCNKAIEKISGYSREELLAMKYWELVDPKYRYIVKNEGRLREQGERTYSSNYEVEIITKNGNKKWIDISVKSIEYNGKWAGMVMANDITEKKLALYEIESLKKLLNSIIDSMPSSLVTVDRNFNIVYWNKIVEKKFNLKQLGEKTNKLYVFDLFKFEDDITQKLKFAFNEKKSESILKKSYMDDGGEKYETITIFPISSNGIDGAVIKIDDITKQIKFQEMIIHSDKMISIGNMAAGIAHEINNPLAIVMQACDVCITRLSKDSDLNKQRAKDLGIDFSSVLKYVEDRKILKMLNNIKDATQRAADIIRGLLAFSGKYHGEMKPTDVREVMDSALMLAYTDYSLKKKYDVRKIRIIKEYSEIPLINADPINIQQVFLNIIKNGAHAMAGQKDPCLVIRIFNNNYMVRVEIIDNGCGIPKEITKQIFDPFFTTKEVGEGVGLGLYISYFIIKEQHGGRIDVKSSPGKGATFIIDLPISSNYLEQ